MKLEGSIQEIKEFIKEFQSKDTAFTKQQLSQIREEIKNTPVAGTTDVIPPHEIPLYTCDNLPPHTFPLLNKQEYQRIYKEAQQEVPKEEKN